MLGRLIFALGHLFTRGLGRLLLLLLPGKPVALCRKFFFQLRNTPVRDSDLLRERCLFGAQGLDLPFGVVQFSFQEKNSVFGRGLRAISRLRLSPGFREIMRRFFEPRLCFIAFLPQRLPLRAENRMFRGQNRDLPFSFEQGGGWRFAPPGENDSVGGNKFAGERRGREIISVVLETEGFVEIGKNRDLVEEPGKERRERIRRFHFVDCPGNSILWERRRLGLGRRRTEFWDSERSLAELLFR